jgi:hypothetical protein
MKHLLPLLLLFAQPVLAGLPTGLSAWRFDACTTKKEQAAQHCKPISTELVALRIDNKVCGFIVQSSSTRSPSGWFSGELSGQNAQVRFVDSFQINDQEVGHGVLSMNGRYLVWRVLDSPSNGLIDSEPKLRRHPNSDRALARLDKSCADLEASRSPVTIRLDQ